MYNGIDWPGINTALATCIITALATIGSSWQKQVLRIGGALAGGFLISLPAQIYLLPLMDSITTMSARAEEAHRFPGRCWRWWARHSSASKTSTRRKAGSKASSNAPQPCCAERSPRRSNLCGGRRELIRGDQLELRLRSPARPELLAGLVAGIFP